MARGNTYINNLLLNQLNGTAMPGAYTGPYYLALYTASPGAGGSANTNEATYTGYARVSVAKTSGGWTVSGQGFVNAAQIAFPQCTGGTNTITHAAIVTTSSGAGDILYFGPLSASIAVSNLITPIIAAGAFSDTDS